MNPSALQVWISLIITMALWLSSIQAQENNYKFYYVAVGNDNYASFPDLLGMGISARVVSEYFDRFGAIAGITLRSKNKRYISKQMILENIDQLQYKMNDEDGKQIVMIFYYAGHCLGEPLTGQQWLFPGNLEVDSDDLKSIIIDSDQFDKQLLSPIELHGSLGNSMATQTMIIMDCCYNAGDNTYQNVASYLTKRLGARQASFIDDLRDMNITDDPWQTSLYATTPGKRVYAVKAPNFMAKRILYSIGPLSRRLSLILNALEKSKSNLSYQSFVNAMKDPELDKQTRPANVYNKDLYIDGPLFTYTIPLSDVRLNQIYASKIPSVSLTDATETLSADKRVIESSVAVGDSAIYISSEKDDWIGQGKKDFLSAKDYKIRVAQDYNRLVISAQGTQETDKWTFEILLPEKYRTKKPKVNHHRGEHYYWEGNNAIEVSVLGRGCSTRKGDYVIKKYQRNDQDAVTRLKMEFTHYCDDASDGLNGNMNLILEPLF